MHMVIEKFSSTFQHSLEHLLFQHSLTTKNNAALTMISRRANSRRDERAASSDVGFEAARCGDARPLA
jgi:hypothetical protein